MMIVNTVHQRRGTSETNGNIDSENRQRQKSKLTSPETHPVWQAELPPDWAPMRFPTPTTRNDPPLTFNTPGDTPNETVKNKRTLMKRPILSREQALKDEEEWLPTSTSYG